MIARQPTSLPAHCIEFIPSTPSTHQPQGIVWEKHPKSLTSHHATAATTNPPPTHIHLSPGVKAGIGLGIVATVILSIFCCCVGPIHWSRGRRRRQCRRLGQDGFQSNENEAGVVEAKEGSDLDLEGRSVVVNGKHSQRIGNRGMNGEGELKIPEFGFTEGLAGTREGVVTSEMPVIAGSMGTMRDRRAELSAASVGESEVQIGAPPPAYRP